MTSSPGRFFSDFTLTYTVTCQNNNLSGYSCPIPSILTALFPRNMLSNVSICIEGYKWRLRMKDPLSFLLNLLLIRKSCSFQSISSWFLRWLTICLTLFELDHLHNRKLPLSSPLFPGKQVLNWLLQNSHWCLWHVFPFLLVYFSFTFFVLYPKGCFLFYLPYAPFWSNLDD